MNKIILCGRLVREPEERSSASGMTITRYTIAVDRRKKRNGEDGGTDYFTCVAFDKAGDFARKYFSKGMRVLVTGRVQTGSYTNKDGQKVPTWEINVEEQEFADGKNSGTQKQDAEPKGEPKNEGFMDIAASADDDGLPFN